jgi:hypothetical protein
LGQYNKPSAGRTTQIKHTRTGPQKLEPLNQLFKFEGRSRGQTLGPRSAVKLIVGLVSSHRKRSPSSYTKKHHVSDGSCEQTPRLSSTALSET